MFKKIYKISGLIISVFLVFSFLSCVSTEKKDSDANINLSSDNKINDNLKTEKNKKFLNADMKLIPPSNNSDPFIDSDSFVNCWHFIGPFENQSSNIAQNELQNLIQMEFVSNEDLLYPGKETDSELSWSFMCFNSDKTSPGAVLPAKIFKNKTSCIAYAVSVLESPCEMNNINFLSGSSDSIKVWLNGKLIHAYIKGAREAFRDLDKVSDLNIRKGKNVLIIKTLKIKKPWKFFVRFTDSEGMPIETRCIKKRDKTDKTESSP